MLRLKKVLSKNENTFWKWFTQRSDEYFAFEENQEPLFDELNQALAKVHPDLCFEFGPVENGKREFVISAGGIRESFPAVTSLYRAAPELKQWTLIAFRPRREVEAEIEIGDKCISTNDLWFRLEPDKRKVGLSLFVNSFLDDERDAVMQILYLLLDNALGEYDVETKVGFIEVEILPENPELHGLRPFHEIPEAVDQLFARIN